VNKVLKAVAFGGFTLIATSLYKRAMGTSLVPSSFITELAKVPQLNDIVRSVAKMSRGYRNNNAGNIRKGQPWNGLRAAQTDSAFDQFIAPKYGVRAVAVLLGNYQTNYGLNTVLGIITRYAPSVDSNPTIAYAEYVATVMGVSINTPFDVKQHDNMISLLTGIFKFENNGVMLYSYSEMSGWLHEFGVTHA